MKKMKRYIAGICVFAMLQAPVSITATTVVQTDEHSTLALEMDGEADTPVDTPAVSEETKKTDSGIYYQVREKNEVIITGYDGDDRSLALPSTINGSTVVAIQSNAFANAGFVMISIPESIEKIENNAFSAAIKTIKCYKGSTAYTYAKKNKITVMLLDPVLNITKKTLNAEKTVSLKVKNPTGATIWKSSNSKIAKVTTKGVVTARKSGTAYITAFNNGHKAICTITVTNMKLSKTRANVTIGKQTTLQLVNAGKNKVSWKSDQKSVAVVTKKGVVTGKKVGTATITAVCRNMTFTCKVKVLPNEAVLYSYDLDVSDLSPNTGYIGIKSVQYSGNDLKFNAFAFNNYARELASASTVTIRVYANGREIGQQVYMNRSLNVKAHSQKKMTFLMKSKNIKKKNIDLRTGKITATVTVGMCSFA